MSKKSYKRHQNRLYREIKQRILAEQKLIKPIKFSTCERKIETLKVERIVPNYYLNKIEIVKSEMARSIADTLIAEGYVEFITHEPDQTFPVQDFSRIAARLYVIRPLSESW